MVHENIKYTNLLNLSLCVNVLFLFANVKYLFSYRYYTLFENIILKIGRETRRLEIKLFVIKKIEYLKIYIFD